MVNISIVSIWTIILSCQHHVRKEVKVTNANFEVISMLTSRLADSSMNTNGELIVRPEVMKGLP